MASNIDRQQKKSARRSRTGCLYCRGRKIKCDEAYPSCGECSRIGRKCDSTTAIFRQHKSSFALSTPSKTPPQSGTGSESTTTEDSWVQIPGEVVFVNDSAQDEDQVQQPRAESEIQDQTSFSVAVTSPESITANNIDFPRRTQRLSEEPRSAGKEHGTSDGGMRPSTAHGLDRGNLQHRQNASSKSPNNSSATVIAENSLLDENRETSFFLRHFSETPGMWMDLFDLDRYYSRQVPVLARHNELVKYAACAFAAKQLGRVHGRKSVRGGVANRLSDMETWPEHGTIDYAWFGMKYYDKSISMLMEYISEGNHAHRDDYNRRYDDETIVAATMLCNYEFLSATTVGWSGHLDGTQSLLRLTNQSLFQFEPSPRPDLIRPKPPTPPKALRAAFWNFARQDFLASIITRKHTRLSVDDLDMWCAMGLRLDENGLVASSKSSETSGAGAPMRDDMIANALVWLLCKIANFIATHARPSSSGGHNEITADESVKEATWRNLDIEIRAWHEGLPATFEPSARIQLTASSSPSLQWETWYSNSMCASTMQSYHMARMLLLINQPAKLLLESPMAVTNGHDLLAIYRSMQAELRGHAIEICSIAQGRPDDGARVHMLQPMYFAGRCLTDSKDQKTVIKLIGDIERDLGWATEYRVEQLLQEWDG